MYIYARIYGRYVFIYERNCEIIKHTIIGIAIYICIVYLYHYTSYMCIICKLDDIKVNLNRFYLNSTYIYRYIYYV